MTTLRLPTAAHRTQPSRPAAAERIAWSRLPIAWVLTAAGAALANGLVFLIGSALGTISPAVALPSPAGFAPLTAGQVALTSIAGALGAALVFAAIGRFARRPIRVFRIVATAGLLLSYLTPATLPGVPLPMVLTLETMHVIAWAFCVGLLPRLATRRAGA